MSLQTTTHLNVDFYDKKYIMVNAKQYDDSSRWISITCYNQGNVFNLNASSHSAYIKYKKADGHGVLNHCKINYKGEILVELTEQMLAADGICYVDLTVINKGHAMVNIETGDIIAIDDTPILSTMAFCINVHETVVDNSEIESSYEYDALNDLMQRAEAEYKEVVQLSKSYAVGNANEIRDNENTDNAKYYYEQSLKNATNAKTSEDNAKTSEQNAKTSEDNAKVSEDNAKTSEQNAKTSEQKAEESRTNILNSEQNAKTSENNAKTSEVKAYDYSVIAKRYAIGGTNTALNEDTDNSKYYYEQTKNIMDSVNGTFLPKGTISFEELATVDKFTGSLYIIKDDFITDDTFVEGADIAYPSGTVVYCTVDGYWSCFDGFKTDVAMVDEVIAYLGI